MAYVVNFRKFWLGEFKFPSSLCSSQYPPEVSQAKAKDIGQLRKGLDLNLLQMTYFCYKTRWKLRLVG